MAVITDLDAVVYSDVKTYLGIPTAETGQDARITAMLPLAVAEIRNYCRDDFEASSRSETFQLPYGKPDIFLTYYPVSSTGLTVVEDGTALVLDSDYTIENTTGRLNRLDANWVTSPDKVVVTYTGGENLTYKQEILTVLYELIGIRCGLKTRSYTTGEGIQAAVTITSLPDELLDILERHKKCRLGCR